MLIGLVGLKGSGKDTVARTLQYEYGFKKDSFAKPLKDIAAILFGYNRKLVEGDTSESREWREQPDLYWSQVLGRTVSPRSLLQELGTEVFRNNFCQTVWIDHFKQKYEGKEACDIVISDVRFGNEMRAIGDLGGVLIRIKRGDDPQYIKDAIATGETPVGAGIHLSELDWALNADIIDYTIFNDSDLDGLQEATRNLIQQMGKSSTRLLEIKQDGIGIGYTE